MSFDPFHEQQPLNDPVPRPSLGQDATPVGDPARPIANVRDRVMFPAILLIIAGVVNLLFAGGCILIGAIASPEFIEKAMNDPNQPQFVKDAMAQNAGNATPAELAAQARIQYLGIGIANVLTMFFSLFAGVRMLQLRNYGLVFFGAIAAAVPCVSGSGCCCIGEIAGIYSIIMLLQPDIRDAFR
jgi:hypothetical protein